MKKSIYIPDDLWEEIELGAERSGMSVSEFLLSSFKRDSQLDRVERLVIEILEKIALQSE